MPILAQISYKPEWQQNFLRITAHSGKGRQGLKKKNDTIQKQIMSLW